MTAMPRRRTGSGIGRPGRLQFGSIVSRRLAKSIELMRAPEVSRLLFHKLRGQIDPIELLECGRQRDLRECLETLR